ncbi:MAG TPA: DUF4157 domain-containing protein [Polyangiaceae bacterium]
MLDSDSETREAAEHQAVRLGARIGESLAGIASVTSGELAPTVRHVAEAHLGVSLAGTRLVDGDARARREGARAVTEGSTIHFLDGELSSRTPEGRALLGHELTHVAQQRATGIQASQCDRLTMTQIKKNIADKQRPDVTALANALPPAGAAPKQVSEGVVNGVKHVFFLQFAIDRSAPTLLSTNAGSTDEEVKTTGRGATQTVVHTIKIRILAAIPHPDETLFHELVHARIIIDRSLPEGQQGTTYRRYAQIQEMATQPPFAVKQRNQVIAVINTLRGVVAGVPGFDKSKFGPKADPANLYELVVNEKFTNTESSTAFGSPLPNATIARRYASVVEGTIRDTLFAQGLNGALESKTGGTMTLQDKMDNVTEMLTAALLALYDELDRELKEIADAKKRGPERGVEAKPGIDIPPRPPPVGIGGESVTR